MGLPGVYPGATRGPPGVTRATREGGDPYFCSAADTRPAPDADDSRRIQTDPRSDSEQRMSPVPHILCAPSAAIVGNTGGASEGSRRTGGEKKLREMILGVALRLDP